MDRSVEELVLAILKFEQVLAVHVAIMWGSYDENRENTCPRQGRQAQAGTATPGNVSNGWRRMAPVKAQIVTRSLRLSRLFSSVR